MGAATPGIVQRLRRLLDAGSRRMDFSRPRARIFLALLALAAVAALATAVWLAHVDARFAAESVLERNPITTDALRGEVSAQGGTGAIDARGPARPGGREESCNVVVPATPPRVPKIIASARVTPAELRPNDRYEQEFKLTNRSHKPVTVLSISSATYQNGKLLRSTPGWYNPARHAGIFRDGAVPPWAQGCVIYRAPGEYTRQSGCGEMKARYTFHTTEGDLVTSATWRGICE